MYLYALDTCDTFKLFKGDFSVRFCTEWHYCQDLECSTNGCEPKAYSHPKDWNLWSGMAQKKIRSHRAALEGHIGTSAHPLHHDCGLSPLMLPEVLGVGDLYLVPQLVVLFESW